MSSPFRVVVLSPLLLWSGGAFLSSSSHVSCNFNEVELSKVYTHSVSHAHFSETFSVRGVQTSGTRMAPGVCSAHVISLHLALSTLMFHQASLLFPHHHFDTSFLSAPSLPNCSRPESTGQAHFRTIVEESGYLADPTHTTKGLKKVVWNVNILHVLTYLFFWELNRADESATSCSCDCFLSLLGHRRGFWSLSFIEFIAWHVLRSRGRRRGGGWVGRWVGGGGGVVVVVMRGRREGGGRFGAGTES